MPICTITMTYEVYEGNLGTDPLPFLSWSIYINGLSQLARQGMRKCHPELVEGHGGSLTITQTNESSKNILNLASTYSVVCSYLNFLDGEGFKVVGNVTDSSTYSRGVTKLLQYTLQN